MSSDSGISGTPKSMSLQTPKTKCSKMMTKRSLRANIYLADVIGAKYFVSFTQVLMRMFFANQWTGVRFPS